LYGIICLVAASVALLLRACDRPSWWPAAILFSVVAVPAGWYLLGLGLEQHVEKYGLVFSGTQFLLGPDRQRTLSETTLFARWVVLQVGVAVTLAAGAWIADRLATGVAYYRSSAHSRSTRTVAAGDWRSRLS
jgi:hypothetical protein